MKSVIKILIAEHDKHDSEMIDAELKKGELNYVTEKVENETSYIKALENFKPDVILCDYTFPSFDGPAAFLIRNKLAPHTPFILVSGTIGEENSIELIKNGVTDFVLKDAMFTLNIKLLRALKEAKERREKDETEKELKRNAAHLAEAQKLANLGSWDYDLETGTLIWSEQLYKIFGTDKQTFTQTHGSFLQLIDEADRENAYRTSMHTQQTGETFIIDYHITTAAGEKRVIQEHGYGVKDAEGKVVRLFGTAQDITEIKKTAAALEKAYDEKNAVLESIDDGFFATDKNSLVTYWNKKAETMLGVKKEDVHGKNLHEIFADSRSEIFFNNYQKAIRENSTVHFEGFSKRENKWFAVSAFGSEYGLSVYFKDVTVRKNDEEKLKESELRYRQIVETAQEGIWLTDKDNKTTFVNKKMCEILGYTETEMIGKEIFYFMDDEGKEIAARSIGLEKQKDEQAGPAHFKYISKSGNEIWTNVSANPLFDNNGIYKGSLAMVTNITQSRNAENKDRFQATLLNTIGQATIATDVHGTINYWNKAASAIYGWTEEEVLGKNIIAITPVQQTTEQAKQIIKELLLGNTWSGEFMMKRKDGSEFPAYVTNAPIYDSQHQLVGIIGVSSDITERRQAEILIMESEAKYRTLFEQNMAGVYQSDANGVILNCNNAFARMLKYNSPAEVLTINASELYFSATERNDFISKVTAQKSIYNYESVLKCKDGSPLYFIENISLWKDEKTGEEVFNGVMIDITEKKTGRTEIKRKQ